MEVNVLTLDVAIDSPETESSGSVGGLLLVLFGVGERRYMSPGRIGTGRIRVAVLVDGLE